jgi:hypothetical protein
MWRLYRELPAGKTYAELMAEDDQVEFNYFVSTNPTEPNAEEVTDIKLWDKYHSETPQQYGVCRTAIQTSVLATGWTNLNHEDKMLALKYRAFPNATVDTATVFGYLMAQGNTQPEAAQILISFGAIEQARLIEACQFRGSHPVLFMIIGKYLSIEDQADLNELVDTLLNKYMFRGLRGTLDGQDGNVGLFDFIEGTAGDTNLAAQGYTMLTGDTDSTNLINELMDWLRHGKSDFLNLLK